MSKLKIYDSKISREEIKDQRLKTQLLRSPEQRILDLFVLNAIVIKLNGGKPLKQPQGKGIVISRSKPS